MLGEHIKEILGKDIETLLVVADTEFDICVTDLCIENIILNQFAQYGTVATNVREQIKLDEKTKNGVYINVNKSKKIPINIVLEHNQVKPQYIFIDVQDNVEVSFIEQHIACDCNTACFVSDYPIIMEFKIGKNAQVTYNAFDTSGMNYNIQRYISVDADSSLHFSNGFFGESCQSENYFGLMGKNAQVEMMLMMYAENQQRQMHKVKMSHFAPYTVSNMTNHGVVSDEAYGKFEGIGFIEKGCHQANAQQESRIMVLDETARADVHPILLIDEHDVMAGHAGSVGRVSDEALYYLQSRGLTKKQASLLVTEGFLQPVVDRLTDDEMKEKIISTIKKKVGILSV